MKEDKSLTVISSGPVNPGEVNAEVLISKALDSGVSVDVMERLLTIRRELKAEAAKAAFDQALARFQSQCPAIKKTKKVMNKDGRTVRYSYAPLEVIVHQVKDLLKANGFSYTLDAKVESGWVEATCKSTHEMGHSETSSFKVPIDKDAFMNEAQKFASALTFTKRYAFCNAFGILTGDEDDDSIASGEPAAPKATVIVTPTPRAAPKEATEKTREWFIEQIGGDKDNAIQYLIEWGWLLPNEGLESLSLNRVPTSTKMMKNFKAAMNAWFSTGELRDPYSGVPRGTSSQDSTEPPGGWQGAAGNTENEYLPLDDEASEQPWYGVIVPVPRKGQKRDEYLKNPDTIGSLYDARHDDEDARRRLWGFTDNYEPKGWTGKDGKSRPPSDGDIKFREALDQFSEWFEKTHPDEKR